jgi:hypothetical protein
VLCYIDQNVDSQQCEKISKVTKSKEAWDILEKYHDGGEKVKSSKLQSFTRKYKLMLMEDECNILFLKANYYGESNERTRRCCN